DASAAALTSDQRGAPFVRRAGAHVDIGAYESQTVATLQPLVVDTTLDVSDGNYSAGNLSLREAVGLANGSRGMDTITFAPALTGIPAGGARVGIQTGSVLQLQNRGYLDTLNQFDPANGGLHLAGAWTFDASGSDFLEILTRSDGTPDPTSFGNPLNGIRFSA